MNFNKKFFDEVVETFNSEYLSYMVEDEYDDDDIDADFLNQELDWFCRRYNCRFAAGVFRISIIFKDEEYIIKYDKSLTKNCFAREEFYYLQAMGRGLEEFLVPIETYCTDSGVEYGVQEKVERCYFDSSKEFSAEVKESYKRINSKFHILNVFSEEVFKFFIQYYGEELSEEFYSFCYKNGIDDIHGGNFGYLNGALVIFDYAGCG